MGSPGRGLRGALFRGLLPGLLLSLSGSLSGCGEEPAAPAATPPRATEGAEPILARLRSRVLEGSGLRDQDWGDDVAQLRALLWPPEAGDPDPRAAMTHVLLTQVAGDLGRELNADPGARERIEGADPLRLELHAAWLEAAAGTPAAYRDWCAGPGAALLRRLEADRQRLFEQRPR